MPKLNRRVRAAARALHFASVAERAHSDGRAAQFNEDVSDEVAEKDFAIAEDYDCHAAEAARAAGAVGSALDSVRGAREEFAREYARWYAHGAEEASRAEWAQQVAGDYVQCQLELACRRGGAA